MTVAELREALKNAPDEMLVYRLDESWFCALAEASVQTLFIYKEEQTAHLGDGNDWGPDQDSALGCYKPVFVLS